MTLGTVRGLLTATLLLAFVALWIWAWSKNRRADFEAAARLPLIDDELEGTRRSE
jgi:cytochrome c oxidase cbb3-type subunit 4